MEEAMEVESGRFKVEGFRWGKAEGGRWKAEGGSMVAQVPKKTEVVSSLRDVVVELDQQPERPSLQGNLRGWQSILLISLLFITAYLSATKVLLITHPPYSDRTDTDNISYFLMHYVLEKLEMDFEYDYVTRNEAMVEIDNATDAIMFPFVRPHLLSYRIVLSEPFFRSVHKIFYDSRKFDYLEVNDLSYLRPHVVGSHARYRHETELRRAGLTVHYSRDNLASFEKLLSGDVSFVVENKLRAFKYINMLENEDKSYIKSFDIDLFPEHFHVIAPFYNENALKVLDKINDIINERDFLNGLIHKYYNEIR